MGNSRKLPRWAFEEIHCWNSGKNTKNTQEVCGDISKGINEIISKGKRSGVSESMLSIIPIKISGRTLEWIARETYERILENSR